MKKHLKYSIVSLLAVILILFAAVHGKGVMSATADITSTPEEDTTSDTSNTSGSAGTSTASQDTAAAEVESKEEVIYATLNGSGEVKEMYAVNVLNVLKEGRITDYGDYTDLKNLTNTNALALDNQAVTAHADNGRFYYQGTLLNTALPWKINIEYNLNGNPVPVNKLAGSSGELEIHITTSSGDSVKKSFYDNYLLQVSVTLNTELCSNISAEGATLADSGKNQVLTFTVMPDTDGDIMIKADVTKFEMDSITVSAVPFTTNIELPDISEMSDNLTSLSDAIARLNDGTAELKDGAGSLNSGAAALKDGSADYMDGIKALNSNSKKLTDASGEILNALSYISTNLETSGEGLDLGELKKLPAGLTQLAGGLDQVSGGITALSTGYSAAYKALGDAIAAIPQETIAEEELQKLIIDNPNNEAFNLLLENYKAAQTIKETYKSVSAAFEAVNTNLPTFAGSIGTISSSVKTTNQKISTALGKTDIAASLSDLTTGISTLKTNYTEFDNGLKKYTQGLAQLNSAYSDVNSGISSLSDGTKELSLGINDLADGTSKLNDKTKDMPEQMNSTIDEMMGKYDKEGYTPESYVSDRNKNVSLVQFVIRTDKIELKKTEQTETVKKDQDSFWSRLKNLFL